MNGQIPPDVDAVLDTVTKHYLTSRDFNGTPLRLIDSSNDIKRDIAKRLIEDGKITLNFGDVHPNPYIQAFDPDPSVNQVEELGQTGNLEHVCMYPTKAHLAAVVNRADYAGRPFTFELAVGAPQIDCRFFELRILEHYRNDPRYMYQTDDIQGNICIRNEYYQGQQIAEKDKVLLQQFGFGYDKEIETRVVAVLLCDLTGLSSEHQQIWKAHELVGEYFPHPDFWGSVLGNWPEKVSIFQAFVEELQEINKMAALMGRPPLFRQDFSKGNKPNEFGFLIRPTLAEFNDFALLLDKLMSDNINVDFFQGEIKLEVLTPRADGAVVATQKGSITVLNEWLNKIRFPDPNPTDEMIATFRKVRKLRQKPAHAINENEFDQKYFRDQRALVIDAYAAVRMLRLILANHPQVRGHKVPDWLCKGEIWTR